MKGNGDHGSIVPLNIQQRDAHILPERVEKSNPYDRARIDQRMGTPPTRVGMFNGAMPATTPAPPPNPPLYLGKAVRDPALAGGHMPGDTVARKRDAHGAFATTQSAGPSSTAEEDQVNQQRGARAAAQRVMGARKAFGEEDGGDSGMGNKPQQPQLARPKPPQPMQLGGQQAMPGIPQMPPQGQGGQPPPPAAGGQPPPAAGGQEDPMQQMMPQPDPQQQQGAPQQNPIQQAGAAGGPPGQTGAATGMAGAAANDPSMMQEQPIGLTPDGVPVFNDPYNPAHAQFTTEQHRAAAGLHNQQAEMATSTGQIPTALDHQLKARVHMDLAADAQSPMERVMARQGMPGEAAGASNQMGGGGAPMGGQGDPMDNFMDLMTDKQPGAQNTMTDQNKPLMAQANQGPLPGMLNTNTGAPVGPQSQSTAHAGTVEQPQAMPPEPGPGQGSMPEISGPMPMANEKDALDWDPMDFEIGTGPAGAPPSHGGAPTEAGPDEGIKPTPGGAESEPPTEGAGPTTNDAPPPKKEASGEGAPFGGNPTENKAKEENAEKSLAGLFDLL